MGGRKTRDGIQLRNIEHALESILDIKIRKGTKHRLIISKEGFSRPCLIGTSTHARRNVVSWVKETTGYDNAELIYQGLRDGYLGFVNKY
jgi:hypothetical protein